MRMSQPFIEEKIKTEVINGQELMMSPPAFSNHNVIKNNLFFVFMSYLKNNICIPFGDGEKLVLDAMSDGDYVIPDFFVLCDRSKYKRDGVYGSPDLIVEVLSPASALYDKGIKKDLYQKSSVKEYWIIDPGNKSIEVYVLQDGAYRLDAIYRIPEDYEHSEDKEKAITSFTVKLFPDMTVNLYDIFQYVNEWEQ